MARKPSASAPEKKRSYLKQVDVPSASLSEALRIPSAIFEHYAGRPTSPLFVAKALNIDPNGAQFRFLSGAAIAFGLVDGGAQATEISATDLAKRMLRPTAEGMELEAQREAILKPRVFREFFQKYDGHSFPRQDIALNILEDMGVPRDKCADVLQRIESSAKSVGMLQEIKGKHYVVIGNPTNAGLTVGAVPVVTGDSASSIEVEEEERPERSPLAVERPAMSPLSPESPSTLGKAILDDERRRRVFIAHGQKRDFIESIKKLLEFGELVPVVSVERQSVSKPVPEKFMDDMRGCGAAIIHVDADKIILDKDDIEHVVINPNVLIEIGAAMAFYGRRFILLVRDSVKLPSNLQGLYEVRYTGDVLTAPETIKLLEAIKDIKNHPLPAESR